MRRPWDDAETLHAVYGNSGASHHPVLFFANGQFLGSHYDVLAGDGQLERFPSRTSTSMKFSFRFYRRDDPNCCPTGPYAVIQFIFKNGRLVGSRPTIRSDLAFVWKASSRLRAESVASKT